MTMLNALPPGRTAAMERPAPRTLVEHAPVDKRGGLLVAAEVIRIALEFGLPEPVVVGVGPTGVIEAAMPMADLLGWQKILERPKVIADARHGAILVYGWFAQRQWILRSVDE